MKYLLRAATAFATLVGCAYGQAPFLMTPQDACDARMNNVFRVCNNQHKEEDDCKDDGTTEPPVVVCPANTCPTPPDDSSEGTCVAPDLTIDKDTSLNTYIGNVRTLIRFDDTGGNGGCGSCGAAETAAGLKPLQFAIYLSPRKPGVDGTDGGIGAESGFNYRLSLMDDGSGGVVADFSSPELAIPLRMEDGRNGDPLDGSFNDLVMERVRTMVVYDGSGNPTSDLALAVTAKITNKDGSTADFSIVDINGDKEGRVTRFADRNGYATEFVYKTFTQTEIDANPQLLRQIDTVTDATGRVYQLTYKTGLVGGGSVIDTVILPGGGLISFDYDTQQGTLSDITRPDGSIVTIDYGVDACSFTTQTIVGADGRNQTAYLNSNFAIDGGPVGADYQDTVNGRQIYNQSSMVTQTVEIDDEVRYAIFNTTTAPCNYRVLYRGAGLLTWEHLAVERRNFTASVAPTGSPLTYNSFNNQPMETYGKKADGLHSSYGFHGDRAATNTPDTVQTSDGRTLDLNYSPDNAIIEKIFPDGTYETWERNEFQQPTRHRDRLGRVTRTTHDVRGNVLTREVGLVDAQFGANTTNVQQNVDLPNLTQTIGGTATQSSTGWNGVPGRAVDNNFNGNSFTHTLLEGDAWWEFTFTEKVWIAGIELFNRSGSESYRLQEFTLTVYDGATVTFSADFNDPVTAFLKVGGIEAIGDRVRVQFISGAGDPAQRYLSLAEVVVRGTTEANAGQGYANLTQDYGVSADQSSAHSGTAQSSAARAIDGNANGHYNSGSVSHTQSTDAAPWWEVTLGDRAEINEIVLFNRTDCCAERLRHFRVSVFDGATLVYTRDFDDPAATITSLYGFPNLVGDKVRVEFSDNGSDGVRPLALGEVKVFGTTVGGTASGTRDVATADYALYETQYYPAGHQNEFLKQYSFDALGNRTEFVYNTDQQLVNVIEPDDAGAGFHVAQTFTYNSAKRVETSTDAVGRTTTYDYDDRDRVIKRTYHDTSTEILVYGTGSQGDLVLKSKDRNGNVAKFEYDDSGRRNKTITAYSTMDADGTNEVVNPASLQSVEDCTYQVGTELKESCVRDGDLTTYTYDYRHRLETTTRYPRSGVTLTDSRVYVDNLLFSTTDAYGRNTYRAYRSSDSALIRTVKGTVPSFTLADFAAVNALTRDLNNNADYLITDTILDEEGQRLATIDPRGIQHETDYDSRGRSIARREAVGTTVEAATATQYDANSNVRFQTNPRGYVTEQQYTRRNMLESRIVALGTADQASESFTYFDDRRPDEHIDFRGNTTRSVWHNCCGRLQARIDQAGHGHISNNDYYSNVTHAIEVEDVLSHAADYHNPIDAKTLQEVTTRFDGRHRPIARTVWLTPLGSVDPNNAPIAGDVGFPAADGLTTTYEYFDHALTTEPKLTALLAELTADGIDLDYVDNDGAAALTTNPEGEISVSITDGAGRSIASAMLNPITYAVVTWSTVSHDAVTGAGLLETTSTDALDHQNSSYTDGAGRRIESLDAEGNLSTFEYDANGNLKKRRDPNGVGQDCNFDERNRDYYCLDTFGDATSRIYDANSNVTTMTDAKGKTTVTVYDARDRRESVTDRLSGTTVYAYDDNNNLETITDAETKVTTYTYDVRNLKTHTQYPDHLVGSNPGDADYGIEECSFDALRRKEVCTDQLGDTVTCEYDMASRKLFRKYRLEGAGADESFDAFTYDDASRLLTANKGRYGNAIAYTYDNIGRRETESLTIDAQTYSATHVYDAASRITECTYPDGSVVTKAYSDRNQLETVHQAPDAVTAASLIGQFGYDLGMRELSRLHGNGNITDSTYRLDNLKDTVTVKNSLNATIGDLSFSYGYDANKNITSETTTGTVMAGNSYSATYDDQDRLKTWTRTNAVDAQSWNLDLVGNWDGFTDNGTAQVRTYSDAHETDTIDGNALAHDSKGNLTADTNAQTYVWDIDNHLAQASDAGGVIGDYEYDALGRRVAKSVSGVKTVFFSLAKSPSYGFTPGQVIAEYAGGVAAATPLRTFVYGTYIDEPLAKIESSNTLYYHCNRKYDVAGITDAAGTIVELYAYSPYGTQTVLDASGTDIGISAQNNPYGFTGRRLDEETGLWYFRARYFDSELGRFISGDPLGYIDGMNVFQYVRSNPIRHLDPTGRCPYKNDLSIDSSLYNRLPDKDLGTRDGETSSPGQMFKLCCKKVDGVWKLTWQVRLKPVNITINKKLTPEEKDGAFNHEFIHVLNNEQFAQDLYEALKGCAFRLKCDSEDNCNKKRDALQHNLIQLTAEYNDNEINHKNFNNPIHGVKYNDAMGAPGSFTPWPNPNPPKKYNKPTSSKICGTKLLPEYGGGAEDKPIDIHPGVPDIDDGALTPPWLR